MAELEIYLLKKNNRVNREILEMIDKNIAALKRSCRIQIFLEDHKNGKIPKDREKKLRKRGISAWPTLINATTKKMLNDDEEIMVYLQNLVGNSRSRQRMPEEEAFQENYHDIAREIMAGGDDDENDEKRVQEEYQRELSKYNNKSINQRDQQAAEQPQPMTRRERIVVEDEPYDDGFTDDALDMMQRLGLEDD